MAKVKSQYSCQECGYVSPKWMGKCPSCLKWNTMVEEVTSPNPNVQSLQLSHSSIPQLIVDIKVEDEPRINTNIGELNRVLGGGIVPGSLILVGGDPGIGKSTLLLQSSQSIANQGYKVLYVSGEESVKQIKRRAERLSINSEHLYILTENQLNHIEKQIQQVNPQVAIIDSIQTMYNSEISSGPGSVAQVRECTARLMRIAKSSGIAIIIVGHVTKQGELAGPRLLEHMVDTVLYFEGERHHTYRILRSVKNRFGSTNEIGIFEMKEVGLVEVSNPSELFLSQRPIGVAGSSVVASMEGTRPVLVEIQALLSPTSFVTPRRMATGLDQQRVALIMAVLEKRLGMFLQNQDAYVNVAGGVKLAETGIDLSIAVSIASSFRDKATGPFDVFIGEIGLTGEVRGISRVEQRVLEAKKLGFKRVIIPEKNLKGWNIPNGIKVIGVQTVADALDIAFGG
ncbi:DNA repair protein RadA [Vulcanibacillus modesticaldus]|uniref:DNA repair protein RadA n=1 Tax=Vulcanibacillus modesticaldus TaxID=337097 RepID=A0A1D2YRY1_9BACI|nr:DNA repair protein RadA [Vulcanibacillus modesticaldus]OEF96388.1 DNA repair protein RadA [Vulcanibacillus modesticaldus]